MRTRLVSKACVGKHAFLLCQKRVQCSACWHVPVRLSVAHCCFPTSVTDKWVSVVKRRSHWACRWWEHQSSCHGPRCNSASVGKKDWLSKKNALAEMRLWMLSLSVLCQVLHWAVKLCTAIAQQRCCYHEELNTIFVVCLMDFWQCFSILWPERWDTDWWWMLYNTLLWGSLKPHFQMQIEKINLCLKSQ